MNWNKDLQELRDNVEDQLVEQCEVERMSAKMLWFESFRDLYLTYNDITVTPGVKLVFDNFKAFVENDIEVTQRTFYEFVETINKRTLLSVEVQKVLMTLTEIFEVSAADFEQYMTKNNIPLFNRVGETSLSFKEDPDITITSMFNKFAYGTTKPPSSATSSTNAAAATTTTTTTTNDNNAATNNTTTAGTCGGANGSIKPAITTTTTTITTNPQSSAGGGSTRPSTVL